MPEDRWQNTRFLPFFLSRLCVINANLRRTNYYLRESGRIVILIRNDDGDGDFNRGAGLVAAVRDTHNQFDRICRL